MAAAAPHRFPGPAPLPNQRRPGPRLGETAPQAPPFPLRRGEEGAGGSGDGGCAGASRCSVIRAYGGPGSALGALRPAPYPCRAAWEAGSYSGYPSLSPPCAWGSHPPPAGDPRGLTAVRTRRQPCFCRASLWIVPTNIPMAPSVFNITKALQIRSEQRESAPVSGQGTCQVSLPYSGLEDSSSQSFTSLITFSYSLKTVFQGCVMLCLVAVPLAP